MKLPTSRDSERIYACQKPDRKGGPLYKRAPADAGLLTPQVLRQKSEQYRAIHSPVVIQSHLLKIARPEIEPDVNYAHVSFP